MSIDELKNDLPEYAKDLKLNLSSVLGAGGAPGLSETQVWGVALASALAARNPEFARGVERLAAEHVDEATIGGAKAAAAIMGMNNVYYRFTHLVGDPEYGSLPARLRMNVMARPGIERVDFELYSLAVSAIHGCGTCVQAHEKVLREQGLGREAVQSAARIAAVVNAVAGTLAYERRAA